MKRVIQARRIDKIRYKNALRPGGGETAFIDDHDIDEQKRQQLEDYINGGNDAVDEETNTEHPPYNSVVHDQDGEYYLALLKDE